MRQVGDGTRTLNFLADTLVIFILAYIGFKTWNWYVIYWQYPAYNFGWFFFGILFVYYTVFEGIFGRTPGKWLTYSRVVDARGRKPLFVAILLRSLVRITIVDLFFIPFLGRPLHDYLSKTWVVEA
ncbi:RDD family protein [Sediminibacterium soli]|uniref:RDD family protein n=1 Tax=Sediminibacterium soli TaxID=2698829 RepID=UPI001379EC69|nr:RDD family protein [Sediminibacterium soli]NCI48205.1 RDD family protein [Sediminibacterium soli]